MNEWHALSAITDDTVTTTMEQESYAEQIAEYILYELWFAVAEALFERVAEATELDEEQRTALRAVALRPNDFQIRIE